MADSELDRYIRTELSKGSPVEQIQQILLAQGWREEEITNAINAVYQQAPLSSQSPQAPKAQIRTERYGEVVKKCLVPAAILVLLNLTNASATLAKDFFELACIGNLILGPLLLILFAYRYTDRDNFTLEESSLCMGLAASISSLVNYVATIILALFGIMLGSALGVAIVDMGAKGDTQGIGGGVVCAAVLVVFNFAIGAVMGAIGSSIASSRKKT